MRHLRGFTFIEVLVSLLIISMMLLVFHAVLRSAGVVAFARNQDLALTIARNEIEKLRKGGYDALPSSGPFSDALLSTLPSGSASLNVAVYNTKTKQITASVFWQDRTSSAPSSVSLSTLITQIGGLP